MSSQKESLQPELINVIGVQPVGVGGMADVYLGEWMDALKGSQKLAIKAFRGEHLVAKVKLKADIERRLARETGIWITLQHENVLEFYGTCHGLHPIPDSQAMVSPWMSNGTMPDYVKLHPDVSKAKLISEVAAGLVYLHSRNIIHGDLKGNNVLINDNGVAVICDFGRAKIVEDDAYSLSLIAAAAWTAPELLDMENDETVPISFKSDVWALGMTTLELYSGDKRLWNGVKPAKIIITVMRGGKPVKAHYPDVPKEHWDALVASGCWESLPDKRPTAEAMLKTFIALKGRD